MNTLLPPRISNFIGRIPPEEIARQHAVLAGELSLRMFLTVLNYAFAALLLPLPYVLACAAVDLGAERAGLFWMKGLNPAKDPWRYLGTVIAEILSQLGFTTMLALAYQSASPMAQAFAAGGITLTMLQMASIRAIHLPYAMAGLAISFLMTFVAVTVNWQQRSGLPGLLICYVAICAAAYFVFMIVRANHALHDGVARERAAAKAADLAKSRFLAQMSHELRTPLNAILGLGHVELAQHHSPASDERLRLITDAARGLAVILDDILDMSAIEAGHLPIRATAGNPVAELNAAVGLFAPLFQAQDLTLTVKLNPALPTYVELDSQRLRQCMSNLLSNAIKHTTAGGATVIASPLTNNRLQIDVIDSGPGIPASEAERIFQPFQRGISEKPGSGLGLSITRSLARSMGGDLELISSPSGAHFRLTLAFHPKSMPQESPAQLAALPTDLSQYRVLIVDDIATNRLVAKAHLQLFGLATQEAASGIEAIDFIKSSPPDIVFLDMNMPEMDGSETLKRIRTLPTRAARVHVIAMTADATEAHRRKYTQAGLDGYLAKPLTPEAVREVLSRFLATRL